MRLMTAAALSVLLGITCPAKAASPKPLFVQVRQGEVRATPSHLGKLVGQAELGSEMNILGNKGAWLQVSSSDGKLSGWMHSSLLTKKKVAMEAGDSKAELAASSEEMSLATKGFNSDVEAAFKNKNPDVSFEWVDKMEAIKVNDSDITKFLKEGEVKPAEAE